MIRHFERIDNSHDKLVVKCQSATERDQHRRAFPDPLPDTHELAFRWTGEMTYEVYVRVKGEADQQAPPAEQQDDKPLQIDAKLMIELQKLPRADLLTKAAENNVEFRVTDSSAKIIAAMIPALAAKNTQQ